MFQYGIVCGLEPMSIQKPVILTGTIESVADVAMQTGYAAMELHIRNPRQYDAKALRAAADARGLSYCGIATGMEYLNNHLSLISDDRATRRAAIDRLKEHIDLGAELDCPVIVGIMRSNIPDLSQREKYLGYHSEALVELSEYAEAAGGTIVVESIMRYINNYLNSVAETTDYLNELGLHNVKLHIDTHSMMIEDRDLAGAVRYAAGRLDYVHFSDSNRMYPGGGNIDFLPVMRALMEVGYDGYIGLECVPVPTQRACAERGIGYLKALETVLQLKQ